MIADDLFSGAGGWDLAAEDLGIWARGVELMPEARATREAAGLTTIHDDVWTYRPAVQASGLIASPPCQTFSTAGKGSGRKALNDVLRGVAQSYYRNLEHLRFLGLEVGDDRTALVLTPLHFATQYDYEWLAWEQVPTVLPVWEACAGVLRASGWNVWTGLLHAEQYGVPQTRKRAFLLASRHGEVTPPTPTHSRYYSRSPEKLDEGVQKWVSMAEAIGWGLSGRPAPTLTGGGTETGGAEPIAKWKARWATHPEFTARALWLADTSPRRPGRVSVAEAGLLQSFPSSYPWQGAKGKQYLQVGNAVPPGLARAALSAAVPQAEEVAA
jgi:DNA (cytosine-5)-methyltransferase 1